MPVKSDCHSPIFLTQIYQEAVSKVIYGGREVPEFMDVEGQPT
jgi:hypothetical protein